MQKQKIQIHPDDLNLERAPKNFFETLASMESLNESDI